MKPPAMLYYPDFHPAITWLRSVLLVTDEVNRIVPTEFPTDDPPALAEMRDAIDGCLINLPPTAIDISPTGDELVRLDRAFASLQRKPPRSERGNAFEIVIHRDGAISFPGYTLLADAKIADEVRSLLQRHHLQGDAQTAHARALHSRAETVVRRDASYLILSLVADRMARRHGLNTLTDRPLEYAFNALNGLDIPFAKPAHAAEGLLTAAFASVLIRAVIATIRLDDYRILRDGYSDLRAAIRRFVLESNAYCGLQNIGDLALLQERVVKAASEVQREYQKFRKSRFARRIVDWTPFVIGGLLPLLADLGLVPKEFAWSITTAGFGFKLLQKVRQNPNMVRDRLFSLCTSLDYNVKALLPTGS